MPKENRKVFGDCTLKLRIDVFEQSREVFMLVLFADEVSCCK